MRQESVRPSSPCTAPSRGCKRKRKAFTLNGHGRTDHCYQGGSRNLRKGRESLLFPYSFLFLSFSHLLPLPFPLEARPLKPARGSGERCKLPQWGPERSLGRKRIWCTLSESHWWQSFWIFRVPCFTVEWSKFSVSKHDREWLRHSVARRGEGTEAARPLKIRHWLLLAVRTRKWNWNKTVSKHFWNCFCCSRQNSRETFFGCFSQSVAGIRCLCKTSVCDVVNQTLVNKHGDHIALL